MAIYHKTASIFNQISIDSTYLIYGGFEEEAVQIDLTAGSWYHITNATHDLWSGTESYGFVLSGDVMTISNPGDYIGMVSLVFEGGNGVEYQFRLYNLTDSEQAGYILGQTGRGTGSYSLVTLPLYFTVNGGSRNFKLQVRSNSNDTATFKFGSFWLVYLKS